MLGFLPTIYSQSEGGEDDDDGGEGSESGSEDSDTDSSYVNNTIYMAYYGYASASDQSFEVNVLLDCSQVYLIFVDEDDTDSYSSWGIGGDYSEHGSAQMNGYAVIIEEDNTWETTLDGDNTPEEQSSQDLTCTQDISGSTRTTVCSRSLDTGDENDFNFDNIGFGTQEVIWASLVFIN